MHALRAARLDPRLPHKAGIVASLIIAADILFYDRVPGVSAALFAALLAGGIWYGNRLQFRDPAVRSALILTVAGCLALIENISWLSGGFALAGLVALAVPHHASWYRDGGRWLLVLYKFTTRGVLAPYRDARNYRVAWKRNRRAPARKRQLVAWVLPVGVSLVFTGLFANANPIISSWLAAITDIDMPHPGRVFFWLAVALLCWPFIRPRLARLDPARSVFFLQPALPPAIENLFSTTAIIRSLVIFNAMFAVQTILDTTYLWGGQALPDGMTYAQYAHRGAYPLIAAALLAAGFVLIATRPGSESARTHIVRVLVCAWIAQTIILVGASVWRTSLYVSVYSLTYLRVAAIVWMGLVAAGLVWIVLRLLWNKSNSWLIKANLLTAMSVLYIFCFVNTGGSIAWFNVKHSRAGTEQGYVLDVEYLREIGPPALPALDWYLKIAETKWRKESPGFYTSFISAGTLRTRLASDLAARHRDWRGYTFRSYRLALDIATRQTEIYDTPLPDGAWTVE